MAESCQGQSQRLWASSLLSFVSIIYILSCLIPQAALLPCVLLVANALCCFISGVNHSEEALHHPCAVGSFFPGWQTALETEEMVAARSTSTRDWCWQTDGSVIVLLLLLQPLQQMAWRDLEELVEQGSLSCCSSPSAPSVERQGAEAPQSGADRQLGRPSCCCSFCSRCRKADEKLKWLVLSALPDDVPTPRPDFWEAAWRDLEDLVERGSLSCCSSHRPWSSTKVNKDSLNVHQGASAEHVPVSAPGHVQTGAAHTDSRTQPSCLRSFVLRVLGFSRQVTKPAQTKNQGGKAASRAVGDASEDSFSSWPPSAEDCILRENILLPDGRLPQRPDNLVPIPEWAVNPPAERSSYTEAAGVATRRPAPTRRDVRTSDREENCKCFCGAQNRPEMGSGKERRRADELHAGTCSYTVRSKLGTVTRECIMQTTAAIHWWEQKEQQPVGLSTCPPEVPQEHRTVRPAAAAPSHLATRGDHRSATRLRVSSALTGKRSTEQPLCTCMRPPAEEELHGAVKGQVKNNAQKPSAFFSALKYWGGSITVESKTNVGKTVQYNTRKLYWHVH
ncbi:uncharacterized protein LOC125687011 [Lagopus muta]|uniref:uncharacterized protein LOC125687011 n=1 Tax=Lagopus muta TaxID=64668 RepID=UPI0020A11C8A|nr:uncharacterized protein LOC125687011 [Lagopus muta]